MPTKPTVSITDIKGVTIGHAHDQEAFTGCTVILTPKGAVGGVDQRGGSPGTRETDLLRPMHMVDKVHAILLAGGSAFGLNAAAGVMQYLEENKIGFDTGPARVPIVPAAILYDLGIGNPNVRPDAAMGYRACQNASSQPPEEGNVGAGTGASVGKILGFSQSTKSGIGWSAMEIGGGVLVGAIIAVNAFGDIVDTDQKTILAGARPIHAGPIKVGEDAVFANTMFVMKSFTGRTVVNFAAKHNTMIGAVITNAKLKKEETNKVAQMAHDGMARVVRPAHTMFDGDTLFALATGEHQVDVSIVGAFAAEVVVDAIIRAVWAAKSVPGIPAACDLIKNQQK